MKKSDLVRLIVARWVLEDVGLHDVTSGKQSRNGTRYYKDSTFFGTDREVAYGFYSNGQTRRIVLPLLASGRPDSLYRSPYRINYRRFRTDPLEQAVQAISAIEMYRRRNLKDPVTVKKEVTVEKI